MVTLSTESGIFTSTLERRTRTCTAQLSARSPASSLVAPLASTPYREAGTRAVRLPRA